MNLQRLTSCPLCNQHRPSRKSILPCGHEFHMAEQNNLFRIKDGNCLNVYVIKKFAEFQKPLHGIGSGNYDPYVLRL